MKALRSVLPVVLLAALCAALASCADVSSRHLDQQAQTAPTGTYQEADTGTSTGAQRPNLTIQSGEGEKLNLPWFVRDLQDMVNEGGAPADPGRPPTYQ
jgi:hypothetical protein